MNSINEQREIADEIAGAISSTINLGIEIDDVRIEQSEGCSVS